jgi:branched-chain amino acid transport system permease protein
MALRAVSFNYDAAGLMGINVNTIITLTFMLGSALAAAAGSMVALRNPKIDPLMGLMPGIKAFVAAVLGGIGNFPGAVAGGLLMGLTETLVAAYVSSTYRDAVAFVILIGVLLVKPTGLFGSTHVEKV